MAQWNSVGNLFYLSTCPSNQENFRIKRRHLPKVIYIFQVLSFENVAAASIYFVLKLFVFFSLKSKWLVVTFSEVRSEILQIEENATEIIIEKNSLLETIF